MHAAGISQLWLSCFRCGKTATSQTDEKRNKLVRKITGARKLHPRLLRSQYDTDTL